jgi:hypothetical protein
MTRYSTLINWHDQLVEAEALQTDHESVIGMALLEDSTLTIEVWDGGEVRIEPR